MEVNREIPISICGEMEMVDYALEKVRNGEPLLPQEEAAIAAEARKRGGNIDPRNPAHLVLLQGLLIGQFVASRLQDDSERIRLEAFGRINSANGFHRGGGKVSQRTRNHRNKPRRIIVPHRTKNRT